MPQYTKSIVLDVNAINKHQCVDAKQFDDKSRFLKVTLTANGEPVTIETGTTAMFRAVKPDKKSVCNAAQINSDGTVTVELTQQVLACKGVVEADVSLVGSDGKVLSTASFFLQVQEAPLGNNVASESELLIFQQLADKTAESAAKGAEAAASVKNDAEAAKSAANTAESAKSSAETAKNTTVQIAESLEETVQAAEVATAAANAAASAVGEKIDGILFKDTTNNVDYLAKFRLVGGKPAIEYAQI